MASSQQPLAAEHHELPPSITVHLKPHAHKKQQKDSEHLAKLVRKTDPGHKLKHHIKPLVTSQPLDEIAERVALAAKLDPTYKPVDFGEWYKIEFDPEGFKSIKDDKKASREATELLRQHAHSLHDEDDVESAHLDGVLCPPPVVNWQDDPRAANQGYIEAAPKGINAKYAWTINGGDGAGANVIDIERGWDLNHEDLAAAKIELMPNGTIRAEDVSHGTAVLGQILMVDNTIGGIGIAPSAKGRVISTWRSAGNNQFQSDMFNALLDASKMMKSGDVLLLEAQEWHPILGVPPDPASQKNMVPVEVIDSNYQAIRMLTALGITVVEAGANGGVDLDEYKDKDGKQIFNRSKADFRDSGAILVGAASSTTRERASYSSHGSRIDVYAWGENIDTTDNNQANIHNLYTTSFGGTSGASPIITGAALIVQGIANAKKGRKLLPAQVRRILTTKGTPSKDPASDRIGVMPDLKAIIDGGHIDAALAEKIPTPPK